MLGPGGGQLPRGGQDLPEGDRICLAPGLGAAAGGAGLGAGSASPVFGAILHMCGFLK